DVENATYFVSHMTIVRGHAPGMRPWRKKLFLALSNTSTSPVELAVAIAVADRSAALREEARIKRLPRAAKLRLIDPSADAS
ncbi:MAG: hypothetical protein H0V50_01345, partial [Thermoleophilaceae bacterium]|nr:hypothetical protein [Thermoleophilaceae bacterium]